MKALLYQVPLKEMPFKISILAFSKEASYNCTFKGTCSIGSFKGTLSINIVIGPSSIVMRFIS